MEPEAPRQEFGPEISPENPVFSPEKTSDNSELEPIIERNAEAFEQRSEAPSADSLGQQAAVPILPAPVQDDASQTAIQDDVNDDHPAIAEDVDLIEKEWVVKAKKIITETKDDPRAREEQVNRLQADYLYKRYGKQIGVVDD